MTVDRVEAGLPSVTDLSRILYSQVSVGDVLQLVVDLAAGTPAAIGASVTVAMGGGDSYRTARDSSDLVAVLDRIQYRERQGPSVEAIDTGSEVTAGSCDGRYPAFEEAAREHRVGYVHAWPLSAEGSTWGSLNLYLDDSSPGMAGPEEIRPLMGHAAVVLANAVAWDRLQTTNARLTNALASRGVIGQAQGILMARGGIGPNEAFSILRRASQRTNRKLRDIAAELVGQNESQRREEVAGG